LVVIAPAIEGPGRLAAKIGAAPRALDRLIGRSLARAVVPPPAAGRLEGLEAWDVARLRIAHRTELRRLVEPPLAALQTACLSHRLSGPSVNHYVCEAAYLTVELGPIYAQDWSIYGSGILRLGYRQCCHSQNSRRATEPF